jgi:acetyl esterase/lipase
MPICLTRRLLASVLIFSLPLSLQAQRKEKDGPGVPDAPSRVYKKVGETELRVWILGTPTDTPKPAVVFFFGGGWNGGTPTQFERQARHLASRGMICLLADYRVKSRHGVKAVSCVEDARDCLRWTRSHAKELGIDPSRIAASGGSAGGHLAGAIGTLPDPMEGKPEFVSSRPDALVLFNPALVLAPYEELDLKGFVANLGEERLGVKDARDLSPVHHVRAGLPPAVIFHGEADTTVPFATTKVFAEAMRKAGNRCDLIAYPGEPHGWFNRNGYDDTLKQADAFLTSLGWIPPKN